jgi:hypothetical protein
MAAAAAYDAAFALSILGFADASSVLLGIPLPPDRVYFRFIGVFLLMLAGMYALAAREPRRYQGVVAVAAAGRLAGFAYMAWAWTQGAPAAFLAMAYGDLAFAGLHAFLLLSAREAEAREALPAKRRR